MKQPTGAADGPVSAHGTPHFPLLTTKEINHEEAMHRADRTGDSRRGRRLLSRLVRSVEQGKLRESQGQRQSDGGPRQNERGWREAEGKDKEANGTNP